MDSNVFPRVGPHEVIGIEDYRQTNRYCGCNEVSIFYSLMFNVDFRFRSGGANPAGCSSKRCSIVELCCIVFALSRYC